MTRTIVASGEAKASTPAPGSKDAETTPTSTGTNLQGRPQPPTGQSEDRRASGEILASNYRIKVEYLPAGKALSFSVVTAKSKFRFNGIGKGVVIDESTIPTTISFEGELHHETDTGIFLDYFLGRTMPYVTGRYFGGAGTSRSTSQYQQLSSGVTNGSRFRFGESVKVVESDEETIILTIDKLENP